MMSGNSFHNLMHGRHLNNGQRFGHLLQIFGHLGCLDACDRIYALYGLADEQDRKKFTAAGICVNYHESKLVLFKRMLEIHDKWHDMSYVHVLARALELRNGGPL